MISRDECDHPSDQAEGRRCALCGADVIDVANEARLRVQMDTITGQAAMMDNGAIPDGARVDHTAHTALCAEVVRTRGDAEVQSLHDQVAALRATVSDCADALDNCATGAGPEFAKDAAGIARNALGRVDSPMQRASFVEEVLGVMRPLFDVLHIEGRTGEMVIDTVKRTVDEAAARLKEGSR